MSVILASASPRRKELLEKIGLTFTVIPSSAEENVDPSLTPEDTVKALSLLKGRDIAASNSDALVISADTLVCLDGVLLGKPSDEDDARRMLRRLSGAVHTVYTGVTVIRGDEELSECENTDVYFREITDEEIDNYVASKEPMDKAGAYAAQGLGSVFVSRIDGDFFNVMGLPVHRLALMLRRFGIDVTALSTK